MSVRAASPSSIQSFSDAVSNSMTSTWSNQMRQVSENDRTNVRRRHRAPQLDVDGLLDHLRACHPTATAACVEAETGINRHSVEKWFARESMPSGAPLLVLIWRYGPPLLRAAYRDVPPWLDPDAAERRMAEVDRRLAEARALLEVAP